jgi:Protein of unknown function (DUF3551)
MRKILRAATISTATLSAAIVLGALFAPPAARAGEYCSVDVDFMKNCSFSSMEQCKATVSGMDGGCFPNPSSKNNSIATINRDVYAYSPHPIHRERNGRSSAVKANR